MARKEARIHVSIWTDPDFVALGAFDQRTFLFLVSQPTIDLCGVQALTPGRWSRMAPDVTTEQLRASIDRLADRRFVVVDHDTEEILVRSFVRYDGSWRNQKTRAALLARRTQMISPAILSALDQEIERAQDDLSDTPPTTEDDPYRGLSDGLCRTSDATENIRRILPSPSPVSISDSGPQSPSPLADVNRSKTLARGA